MLYPAKPTAPTSTVIARLRIFMQMSLKCICTSTVVFHASIANSTSASSRGDAAFQAFPTADSFGGFSFALVPSGIVSRLAHGKGPELEQVEQFEQAARQRKLW